ncbi:MAG TPA: tetratricopeptide repeat protein [Spirochaetota bacterium]|nr:tetratricopeptide repeat protein [Spirochaetota bacterium]HOS32489.1 tetratricopeptide repeat protein [Spirochaetota bacterium]HOS56007.1 tetratricopeptide repeat protein [Spirochaetota bacterium]HPK61066.1 tetratricopeptide repeat protein [Spirochaetota bacterium]HQF76732.1 tetratricopeptide repeat protein [Spirochaetota bacterium]
MKKIALVICIFFSLSNVNSLSEVSSLLDAGIGDYKKGQYTFAINNLKKFIQTANENADKPKAYYYLSLSYYYTENYKMALNNFNALISKFRISSYAPVACFWIGLIYQNLKEWEDAEEAFLKYVSLYPRTDLTERAYFAAANSQIELEKYAEAEKGLKTIIEKYKKSDKFEEASVLYAYVLMKNGKIDEADKLLNEWIVKLGKTGENFKYRDRFWLYAAENKLNAKDYDSAKILLKKIDSYSKGSLSSDIALLRLSQIEEKLGNSKESKEYLIRLSAEYPLSKYNIDSTLSMGISEYNKDNFADSIVFFRQTIDSIDKNIALQKNNKPEVKRLNDLKISSYYYLAESYNKINETDKAISTHFEIINNGGNFFNESFLKLLEIYLSENKIIEAKKLIDKYEDKILNSADADKYLIYRAKIEFLEGKHSESLKSIEKIKNKNAFFQIIAKIKSNNYIKQGKYNEALSTLTDVFTQTPYTDKPQTAYEIAALYFNNRDYENAVKYYDIIKTYSKDSKSAEDKALSVKSDYIAGLSYMQLKDYKKGIETLKKIQNAVGFDTADTEIQKILNKSFYYVGWLYYKTSNFLDSAKNFGTASLLDIEPALKKDSFLMEAWSYFSNKDFQAAAQKFENIYKSFYPDEIGVKAYFQMGKCYENLKKTDKSLEVYNKIYKEFPDSPYKESAAFELIKYNLSVKNINETNALINALYSMNPDSTFYYKSLLIQAETFMSLNRYSEAFSNYSFYLKKTKDRENLDIIYYWAGYSAYQIKDDISSLEYLNILIDGYKNSNFFLDALLLQQTIYNRTGDLVKEKETINRILVAEKSPDKIQKYINRLDEIKLIESGLSKEEAELVLKSKSGKIEDLYALALFYYNRGEKERAAAIFKDITDKDKERLGARANNILGNIELDKNAYEEAARIYLKTATAFVPDADAAGEALYKAAYCYFKLDKPKLTQTLVDKLKKDFAGSEWTLKGIEIEKRILK